MVIVGELVGSDVLEKYTNVRKEGIEDWFKARSNIFGAVVGRMFELKISCQGLLALFLHACMGSPGGSRAVCGVFRPRP